MKIGILGGTGSQGFGLAKRWAHAGHDIRIGSRNQERGEKKAQELNSIIDDQKRVIEGGTNRYACESDVIALTIPADQVDIILKPNLDILKNKIILDITVNLKFGKFIKVIQINGKSMYEYIRELLPDSEVVACLKTIAADLLNSDKELLQTDFQMTTSDRAFSISSQLAKQIGLEPVRVRGKAHAETLERMVALAIQLNMEYKNSHAGYIVKDLIL